jgi:hypothetical protein
LLPPSHRSVAVGHCEVQMPKPDNRRCCHTDILPGLATAGCSVAGPFGATHDRQSARGLPQFSYGYLHNPKRRTAASAGPAYVGYPYHWRLTADQRSVTAPLPTRTH